jgi:hypothetical protein
MIVKESKAQTEVWEWKEKASKEFLLLPEGTRLKHLAAKTAALIAQLKLPEARHKPLSKK